MTKIKLENILPIIINNFKLEHDDVDISLFGFEDINSEYLEIAVNFYNWFNEFEATYILNDRTQLFELYHKDNDKILHQSKYISTESELIRDTKKAKNTLDDYTNYKEHPIIRLSELERRKEAQKTGGILIGGKFYSNRFKKSNILKTRYSKK